VSHWPVQSHVTYPGRASFKSTSLYSASIRFRVLSRSTCWTIFFSSSCSLWLYCKKHPQDFG
jgi:hypothetical protein